MTKREDAYKPFDHIRKRFEEIAESLGLEIHNMLLFINDEHMLNVVFTVKPDAVMTEAEKDQRRVDAQFSTMMAGVEEDPFEDKAANAQKELQQWLDNQ